MLEFHTLDVFTDTPYTGNPLAVVLGAEALSDRQMQAIAREFNLSETIFVMPPDDPAHSAKVRIFFPTAEIPFAGHPTLGCAVHLACKAHAADEDDFDMLITLEEVAGLVPVAVQRRAGKVTGEFVAPVLPHALPGYEGAALRPELIAAALDLAPGELGFTSHRPGIWQGGPAFLYLPLANRAALARARPIEPHWSALMEAAGVNAAYLYAQESPDSFHARMFAPGDGIPEDPATGSASAILAAQLRAAGVLTAPEMRFTLHQGIEMGRASRISLTVEQDAAGLRVVRVAGAAVPISQGFITALPHR
jgi:trans-2,3-dihydro-3-hydroxyanthranilate isomerase